MTKTTPKQIVLLFIVLWALVIAVYAMYIITPMLNEKDAAETEILNANDELTLLNSDVQTADRYAAANAELNAKLAQDTSVYYDAMKNSEVDKMLISLINKCGCDAVGLALEDAVPIEDSTLIKPYTETVTAEGEESESTETIIYTGIYVIKASYSVTADYDELLEAIEMINADPSLAIASVSFEQDTAPIENEDGSITVPTAGKDLSAAVTVLVFIYPRG